MKKIVILALCVVTSFAYAATWNVLIYMESGYHLSHVAFKNITDVVRGIAENDAHAELNVAIQVHSLAHEGDIGREAYRYRVKHNKLVLDEIISLSYNAAQDLSDAVRWAFINESENTMLVLWNHGFGILNPVWKDHDGEVVWAPEYDDLMTYACSLKKAENNLHDHEYKALLFQSHLKKCMTINELEDALKTVKTEVLHGKKIDILGMDMCMMSMLEIAWQVHPYAHIMVGSQDCELDYGWDYYRIFKHIGNTHTTPKMVSQSIIDAYAKFYSENAPVGTYTHAATDLHLIPLIKGNIDEICNAILLYQQNGDSSLIKTIKKIRADLPRFCLIPMYTDLYTFYETLEEIVGSHAACPEQEELLNSLRDGKKFINSAVIANCFGKQRAFVHGLSIYFPLSHVDSSYQSCSFAQQSLWFSFIHKIVC